MGRQLLLCISLIFSTTHLLAQRIENAYGFFFSDYSYRKLVSDELSLRIDSVAFNKKRKPKEILLYAYKNSHRVDSIKLSTEYSQLGSIQTIVASTSKIYFYLSATRQIMSMHRLTGDIKLIKQLDPERDSIFVSGATSDRFIFTNWGNNSIHMFDPNLGTLSKVFDFPVSSGNKYQKDIDAGEPIGIGQLFPFPNGKILVKTGYNEAGASFDCVYYLIDSKNDSVQRLPFSHFEKLIADPRKKLRSLSVANLDTFSIDIDKMYYGVFDSVGYVTCRFLYNEKISESQSRSRSFKQDAFAVDDHFNVIGRALEREVQIEYPIYDNGRKAWDLVSSQTDSAKQCFFKMRLSYDLENLFYKIYYDKMLTRELLRHLDSNELTLLKNFIFAKHNYQFDSAFFQAYFNTFTFYRDNEKRKIRNRTVDRLLTKADQANLKILQRR
jgi:hypothetical protein